jgi:hypothetical protein
MHPCSAFKYPLNVAPQIHFLREPASQRAPPEVWERIALHIPRYHLRTWLFVSTFHREIAVHQIFHTVDIYFGEDQENLNRGLDIFDRAKADPLFANHVKCLRLHWAYEEGDMLDLTARESSKIFITSVLNDRKLIRDVQKCTFRIQISNRFRMDRVSRNGCRDGESPTRQPFAHPWPCFHVTTPYTS